MSDRSTSARACPERSYQGLVTEDFWFLLIWFIVLSDSPPKLRFAGAQCCFPLRNLKHPFQIAGFALVAPHRFDDRRVG